MQGRGLSGQGLRARPQEMNSVPAWAQQRLEHGELSLVRPDALINGVASLLAGVSISLLMIWHDEEVLSATWALVIWVAIGAPCCVVGGVAALGAAFGQDQIMGEWGTSLACVVAPKHHVVDFDDPAGTLARRMDFEHIEEHGNSDGA
mmetsp:Transcript_41613/g.110955  ORF Transcript_41613/g.110955 Transcript_41613/m.110955 type:complete len:148 (-) Transcript_41613:180-623(-)